MFKHCIVSKIRLGEKKELTELLVWVIMFRIDPCAGNALTFNHFFLLCNFLKYAERLLPVDELLVQTTLICVVPSGKGAVLCGAHCLMYEADLVDV